MIPLLNPYEDLFQEILKGSHSLDLSRVRKRLVASFAFAIPSRAALEALALEGPIVELGAGTGYWAYLLRQLGVSVEAFDRNPTAPPQWSRVEAGTPDSVLGSRDSEFHQRTLFLCWPPLDEPQEHGGSSLAEEALRLYRGHTLGFIGEWRGRTGSTRFFDRLETEWHRKAKIPLPCWPGFQDELQIWKRDPESP